jgi:hypothetical protein
VDVAVPEERNTSSGYLVDPISDRVVGKHCTADDTQIE